MPRKDDLTILVPRQDDPTEQVWFVIAMRRAFYGMVMHEQPMCWSCASKHMPPLLTRSGPICAQVFVFFPEEVKVGVKTIKVGYALMRP